MNTSVLFISNVSDYSKKTFNYAFQKTTDQICQTKTIPSINDQLENAQ